MHGTQLRSTPTAAAAASPTSGSLRPKRSTAASTAASMLVSPSRQRRATAPAPSLSLSPATPSRSVSQGAVPLTSHHRGASGASPSAQRGAPHRTAGIPGSVAPSIEGATTALSATSAAKDTGVSLSNFAHDGEHFEPHAYETAFRFRGNYEHVALAESTATLWCANESNGLIDLYSCLTGQFVASLPALSEEINARQAELAELPVNASLYAKNAGAGGGAGKGPKASQRSVTPRSRGLVPGVSAASTTAAAASSSARQRFPSTSSWTGSTTEKEAKPTSLYATMSHVWIGYSDGTVAVYDALLLKLLTTGQFHSSPVTALIKLHNDQVVSASADGLLVLWDTAASGFEAVTRVTVLLDAVRAGAGRLCVMTATAHAARVCCGFESGEVYSVFVANRPQEQTPAFLLRAHTSTVNGMTVVKDLLFTAAEDNSVCVWYCGNALTAAAQEPTVPNPHNNRHHDGGNFHSLVNTQSGALTIRSLHAATKLLKRIPVKPCVRGLLAEEQTRSVWVAYADGLLERWSANPDDDFGVEEIVKNALVSKTVDAGNTSTDKRSVKGATALTTGESGSCNAAVMETSVKSLLSLSAVQTMQWLALSSNGVNKVWYGHKNTLEMCMANSLIALHDVIAQDTEDAAAWKEKISVLKQKETERKARYICIMEQLSEQRVLQKHYSRWKQSVLYCGARKKHREALAVTLELRAQVRLARCFFGKWARFYDAQQRHMRSYVLSMALSRATERQQLYASFVAWQSLLVKRRIRRTALASANVLSNMVHTALVSHFFHQWRASVSRRARRKTAISDEHLALLAHKAQRQVQQRVLRQWISHYESQKQRQSVLSSSSAASSGTMTNTSARNRASALSKFATHYAQLQQQRQARRVLQLWRRWTAKKMRYASLAAVATLREQQLLYEARQTFFLRWRQRVHARHTRENAEQLTELEMKLRRAEAEHGDIFEKLQLQKQLDLLTTRQTAEEAQLASMKTQLAALEQSCVQLRAKQEERHHNVTHLEHTQPVLQSPTHGGSEAGSNAGSHEDATSIVSAVTSPHLSAFLRLPGMAVTAAANSSSGRGHMSTNTVFYRSLVDQQRLSPIVLAHMPMEEAVHHVMGQLKGNVINLYTDIVLFRQVKDRRRAGTSAVGILLEAFGELKRMIVSTVRGASTSAASAATRSGLKATRWPLSMEALDCIPVHQCANVLSAIKTMVVAYDLLQPEDIPSVQSTCEEVVANADWVFLIARACYLRRKPLPPANNRQVA